MKNLIITAIISIMLLGAAWAKYESGSNDAASTVLYGTYNGSIVPLKVDSDGSVYPNMTDMTSDITTTGDISGATLKAGGTTGVSEIRLDANDTVMQSQGDRGIYLGDLNAANTTSLYVDGWIYADNNIGIGTTTASASLDVGGGTPTYINGVNDLLVKDDVEVDGSLYVGERVGIGTASNTIPLAIKSASTSSVPFIIYSSDGGQIARFDETAATGGGLAVFDSSGNLDVFLHSATASYINTGANFSIGSDTTPDAFLEIRDGTLTSAPTTATLIGGALEVDSNVYIDTGLYLTSTTSAAIFLKQSDGGCTKCVSAVDGSALNCANITCGTGM